MFRLLMILAFFLAFLYSRENPFQPVFDENQFPLSSNTPKILEPLRSEQFKLPDTARSVTRIIIEYKNLDGSIKQEIKTLNKSVDWHMPIALSHRSHVVKKKHFIKKADLKNVAFFTKNSTMRIITKDKILRNFMMAHPHRVVIDLQGQINFLARKIKNLQAPFSRIRIGNHKDYYRIVVELDGQYEYQLKKIRNGYQIVIR